MTRRELEAGAVLEWTAAWLESVRDYMSCPPETDVACADYMDAMEERLKQLDPAHLRALAASLSQQQAEAEALRKRAEGAELALREAAPILDVIWERAQLRQRMTQPSMGKHPLQDEWERLERKLDWWERRRAFVIGGIHSFVRRSLMGQLVAALAPAAAPASGEQGEGL